MQGSSRAGHQQAGFFRDGLDDGRNFGAGSASGSAISPARGLPSQGLLFLLGAIQMLIPLGHGFLRGILRRGRFIPGLGFLGLAGFWFLVLDDMARNPFSVLGYANTVASIVPAASVVPVVVGTRATEKPVVVFNAAGT